MRINKWLALHAKISRRQADLAISSGKVTIDGQPARIGQPVDEHNEVALSGQVISHDIYYTHILVNKPVGYVCSSRGQGKPTIYELLPPEYHHLKIAGRLDHDSSGLILMTDDGDLILQLTHPRFGKAKTYTVRLDRPLSSADKRSINTGVNLEDGPSNLSVESIKNEVNNSYKVTMSEGRNRQIRRTFKALNYHVTYLERTQLGPYSIKGLGSGKYRLLKNLK